MKLPTSTPVASLFLSLPFAGGLHVEASVESERFLFAD
jgi:hypothetical protein